MLDFFKKDEKDQATKASFEKMQQLLIDANSYLKAGHKDVCKTLLHELVKEAERNADNLINYEYKNNTYNSIK